MTAARSARIADQIQRELAELIRVEVRDPRVGLVTLTGVELSRDQSHAKVFFTTLGAASGPERGMRLTRLIDEAVAPAPKAPSRRSRSGKAR